MTRNVEIDHFNTLQDQYMRRESTAYFIKLADLPHKYFAPTAAVLRALVESATSAIDLAVRVELHRFNDRVNARVQMKIDHDQQQELLQKLEEQLKEAFACLAEGKLREKDGETLGSTKLRRVVQAAKERIFSGDNQSIPGTLTASESDPSSAGTPNWQVLYRQAERYIELENACDAKQASAIADAIQSYAWQIKKDKSRRRQLGGLDWKL